MTFILQIITANGISHCCRHTLFVYVILFKFHKVHGKQPLQLGHLSVEAITTDIVSPCNGHFMFSVRPCE